MPAPPPPPMFTDGDIVACQTQDGQDRVCLTVRAADGLSKYVVALTAYMKLVMACDGTPTVDPEAGVGIHVTPATWSGVTREIGRWYYRRWRQVQIDSILQNAGSPTRVRYPLPEAVEKSDPPTVVEAIHASN